MTNSLKYKTNMFLSDLLDVNEGLNLFHICGPGICAQYTWGMTWSMAFQSVKEVGFGIEKRKEGIGTCFDRSEAAQHSR